MALRRTTQYSTYIGQRVTCVDEDSQPFVLTGATLSGSIADSEGGAPRTIAGDLSIDPDDANVLIWAMHEDDVALSGKFKVQFIADFGGGSLAYSLPETWEVVASAVAP